jgi:hypothetical protein
MWECFKLWAGLTTWDAWGVVWTAIGGIATFAAVLVSLRFSRKQISPQAICAINFSANTISIGEFAPENYKLTYTITNTGSVPIAIIKTVLVKATPFLPFECVPKKVCGKILATSIVKEYPNFGEIPLITQGSSFKNTLNLTQLLNENSELFNEDIRLLFFVQNKKVLKSNWLQCINLYAKMFLKK